MFVSLLLPGCEEMFKAALGPYFVPVSQPSITDNGYIYQVKLHCFRFAVTVELCYCHYYRSSPCQLKPYALFVSSSSGEFMEKGNRTT